MKPRSTFVWIFDKSVITLQYKHYLRLFCFAQQWWYFQAYKNIQDMHNDKYNENVFSMKRLFSIKHDMKLTKSYTWPSYSD